MIKSNPLMKNPYIINFVSNFIFQEYSLLVPCEIVVILNTHIWIEWCLVILYLHHRGHLRVVMH